MSTDRWAELLAKKLKHPLHEYQRIYVRLPKYPLQTTIEIWASRFAEDHDTDELTDTFTDANEHDHDISRMFCGRYREVFAKARQQHGV